MFDRHEHFDDPHQELRRRPVADSERSRAAVGDTITVCNTDDKDTITNISLTNAVDHGPAADSIVTGLTLTHNTCQVYSPTYAPTGCVGGIVSAVNGRCQFSDRVGLSSLPKDEFGNPLSRPPAAQVATCAVCPAGACIQ